MFGKALVTFSPNLSTLSEAPGSDVTMLGIRRSGAIDSSRAARSSSGTSSRSSPSTWRASKRNVTMPSGGASLSIRDTVS